MSRQTEKYFIKRSSKRCFTDGGTTMLAISAIFILIKSLANLQATSTYVLNCGEKFSEESS
jgi:hypothetical protein